MYFCKLTIASCKTHPELILLRVIFYVLCHTDTKLGGWRNTVKGCDNVKFLAFFMMIPAVSLTLF